MAKDFVVKNAWLERAEEEKEEIYFFSNEYAKFITENKTEREFTKSSIKLLKASGFKSLDKIDKLKAGDRVYCVNRERQIVVAVIGEKELTEGLRIIGTHIDSPRLDLKPNPLY